MTDHTLSKVQILIHQKKYAESEQMLSSLLSIDPNNSDYLSLMSEVKLQQDKYGEADSLIDMAISLNPDYAHLYYIKSRICLLKDDYDGAEKYIEQCTSIDPEDADYFAMWANIKLARKQYKAALELSDKALELNAENILALNTRSRALLKLDNKEKAFETIEGALREDPNNAYTHANYGWNLLEKGDHKKAREHFREALKNDPTFEFAQGGMVEALKAGNPIYRLYLKYAFWIGNMTSKYQWAVIIGFFLISRFLRAAAQDNEALQPILLPIIFLMAIIAFSTWIIEPVSNLFLRFNKYGKYLLSKKEIMSANFVGISFMVFVAGVIGYFATGNTAFIVLAGFGFAMMLPFSSMYSPSKGNSLLIYAIAMMVIGVAAVWQAFMSGEVFNGMTALFVIGFIAFQWIANFLLIKQDNR